jgi:hypothetical protein
MASKEERDARLDGLISAVRTWHEKRQKELDAQVVFSKGLLRGRTGSERLNNASVSSASLLLTDEIDAFLKG